MKYLFFLRLFIFTFFSCAYAIQPPATLYIIIHGTWAAKQTWHKPGGKFYDALCSTAAQLQGTTTHFVWSGKLDTKSRLAAGKELAHYIQQLPQTTPVCIVAHSHGANVAILASQELGRLNDVHKIERLYTLGPPVNLQDYMPDMNVINYLYNFFSLHDYVQPVLGIFGRVYPDHPRIANIRISLEGKYGTHSQLHDPLIGHWIPYIHDHLSRKKIGNFETFVFGKPGLINFFDNCEPYYQEDIARRRLLEQDLQLQQHVLESMCQGTRA